MAEGSKVGKLDLFSWSVAEDSGNLPKGFLSNAGTASPLRRLPCTKHEEAGHIPAWMGSSQGQESCVYIFKNDSSITRSPDGYSPSGVSIRDP